MTTGKQISEARKTISYAKKHESRYHCRSRTSTIPDDLPCFGDGTWRWCSFGCACSVVLQLANLQNTPSSEAFFFPISWTLSAARQSRGASLNKSTALLHSKKGSVSFSFAHSDNSHNSKESHQWGIANLLYSYSNMKADTLSMCKAKYYNVCLRAESYKNEGHKRYGCRTQSIGLQAENHRDAGRIPMS